MYLAFFPNIKGWNATEFSEDPVVESVMPVTGRSQMFGADECIITICRIIICIVVILKLSFPIKGSYSRSSF